MSEPTYNPYDYTTCHVCGREHLKTYMTEVLPTVYRCRTCDSSPYPGDWADYEDEETEGGLDEDWDYSDAHPHQCEVCGGEIAGSWSTCFCDEESE